MKNSHMHNRVRTAVGVVFGVSSAKNHVAWGHVTIHEIEDFMTASCGGGIAVPMVKTGKSGKD
jgi:hypothetical protein